MNYIRVLIVFLIFTSFHNNSIVQIKRIWLTHRTNEPSHIVINWQSEKPGPSEVWFRTDNGKEHQIIVNDETTLHHVEIPLREKNVIYYYRVITGKEHSEMYAFKGYPSDREKLRVAIVGNWGYAGNSNLSQLIRDDPHLLLTLGDNIPNLHDQCGEGVKDCIEPFLKLVDSAPELFQSTPFMPILGNHDKEIRDRGRKCPPLPVYDIDATAYRTFFELPDSEWKWHFNVPDFNLCFIALDLNHIVDFGTTWQTCHDFHIGSEQMEWYRKIMNKTPVNIKSLYKTQEIKICEIRKTANGRSCFKKVRQLLQDMVTILNVLKLMGFPILIPP